MDYAAGNLRKNTQTIIGAAKAAKGGNCILATPELALTGCVVCDYFNYPEFIRHAELCVAEIASELKSIPCALVLGTIDRDSDSHIYNCALFISGGKILAKCAKKNLENHEKAWFAYGSGPVAAHYENRKFTVCIGDDWRELPKNNVREDCGFIINIANSSFICESAGESLDHMLSLCKREKTGAIRANACGACDGLIFGGGSFYIDNEGRGKKAALFAPEILSINNGEKPVKLEPVDSPPEELVFQALVLGLGEYCKKCGHEKLLVGLSGGIDSAVVATLACHAVSPRNVTALLMPSPWSSNHSLTDAESLARNLGMQTALLPIKNLMKGYDSVLAPYFAGSQPDTTEENLQARIRGNLLMAYANKFGGLVLATGNKSELAVGYSTLYGDSCGALEVIGDLYKTEVYKLAQWINLHFDGVIPKNILQKAPSAELRPDQKDSDSLPPYPELDPILHALLDRRQDVEQIVREGFAMTTVQKVAGLVAAAQFKRQQSPPVLHVHKPLFLKMPVCGKFPFAF